MNIRDLAILVLEELGTPLHRRVYRHEVPKHCHQNLAQGPTAFMAVFKYLLFLLKTKADVSYSL